MKKKILIIHENLAGGGAEKVLVDILNNFNYNKYDVTLLILFSKGLYFELIPNEVKIKILFGPQFSKQSLLLKKLRLYKLKHLYHRFITYSKLKGERFNTIISFMEGNSAIIHSYLMDKAKRNITWVHIDLKTNNWCLSDYDSFNHEKAIYLKMDDVVFVSQGAKDAFNELFHSNRQTIIYNLIDTKEIIKRSEEIKVNKNKFTICNVGRLSLQKRQDRIIEVAFVLKNRGYDIQFWILGTGPLEDKLKQTVKDKKIDDVVIFKGFQKNPYAFIAASDMFLLTSDSEGYPLVVCEALSLGKAIVSTKVVGPTEILEDGSGILVECDIEEIANVVESLINDNEKRKRLETTAKDKSLSFNVEEAMNNIYNEIM